MSRTTESNRGAGATGAGGDNGFEPAVVPAQGRRERADPAELADDLTQVLTVQSTAADEPHVPAAAAGPAPVVPRRRGRRTVKLVALASAIVVVFAGGAVGYSLLQPTVYGATAEFILTPRPELSDASADRAIVTQAMVITSDPVLRPVAAKVGMPLSRLRGEVSSDIVGRSTILRLTVGDRDQARAVTLADLIATEYLRGPGGASSGSSTDGTPTVTSTVLSGATALDVPLQPKPVRALAAGILLGLLVAAAAVLVVVRPRVFVRPPPHWD